MKNSTIIFLIFLAVGLSAPAYPEDVQQDVTFEVPLENIIPGLVVINKNLTLDEAVDIGTNNSLTLKLADAEVEIKKASLKEAKARLWPTLSIGSLTFLRAGNSQTFMNPEMMMTTGSETFFQDFNATAKMPVFTGGKLIGSIKASRYALESAKSGFDQNRADTAYQIRLNYLSCLLSKEKLRVYQSQIDTLELLLKNTEKQYQLGKVVKADVYKIKTEIADTKQTYNQEEIAFNNSLLELKTSMGVDLFSNIELSDSLTYSKWAGAGLNDLFKEIISYHPKILEAEKAVREAETNVRISKSNYFPQAYAQISGNLRLPSDPPMMGSGAVGMLSVALPVLDFSREAEISKAKANLTKAKTTLDIIKLDIAKQISQIWYELEVLEKNIFLAQNSINQAHEDLRISQRRYDVGRSIFLEVQEALKETKQAELNNAQAVYGYESAKAKLLQILGRVDLSYLGTNKKED